jgi:hypothetical protein
VEPGVDGETGYARSLSPSLSEAWREGEQPLLLESISSRSSAPATSWNSVEERSQAHWIKRQIHERTIVTRTMGETTSRTPK